MQSVTEDDVLDRKRFFVCKRGAASFWSMLETAGRASECTLTTRCLSPVSNPRHGVAICRRVDLAANPGSASGSAGGRQAPPPCVTDKGAASVSSFSSIMSQSSSSMAHGGHTAGREDEDTLRVFMQRAQWSCWSPAPQKNQRTNMHLLSTSNACSC